jgi:WD40 repeat protein
MRSHVALTLTSRKCDVSQEHGEGTDDGDQLVAAGSMDGSVSLLSCVSGELLYTRRVHQKYVVSISWAADARTFVSASWDNSFAVHRTQPSQSVSEGANVPSLVPQSSKPAASAYVTLTLYITQTLGCVKRLEPPRGGSSA